MLLVRAIAVDGGEIADRPRCTLVTRAINIHTYQVFTLEALK